MLVRYCAYTKRQDKDHIQIFEEWDKICYYIITYNGGYPDKQMIEFVKSVMNALFSYDCVVNYTNKDVQLIEKSFSLGYSQQSVSDLNFAIQVMLSKQLLVSKLFLVSDVLIDLHSKLIKFKYVDLPPSDIDNISLEITHYERKYLIDKVLKDI